MSNLTPKQEKFCQEYLVDLNATQAAIRTGYSKKSAKVIGCENLTKPDVQRKIAELRANLADTNQVTPERLMKEYARLGFFDARKLFNNDGSPKNIHDLDDDTAAAVVGLDTAQIGNTDVGIGTILKYKLADKRAALDSMSKTLGTFLPEKHEHTGANGAPLIPTLTDMDIARRLAFGLLMADHEKKKSE